METRELSVEEIAQCIIGEPIMRRVPAERDEVAAPESKNAERTGTPAGENVPHMHGDYGMAPMGETEGRTLYVGSASYDIPLNLKLPGAKREIALVINVGIQNTDKLFYPLDTRMVAYTCHLVFAQGLNYANVDTVYSIWIVTEPDNVDVENAIRAYGLAELNMDGTPTGARVSEAMDKL